MFTVLFAFMLATAYAAEKLPSYIHVCGLKNSNYDECILNSIKIAKSKVCTGMPEFNLSPTEPVIIDEIEIFNTNSLKFHLRDSKIRGYCDIDVKSANTSADRLHLDFDFVLRHLEMDSKYDFDIRLLVSLANKGLIHFSTDNLSGKMIIDLKEVTKNGKTELYASKANTFLDVKVFKFELGESERDLAQLNEALSNTVNENTKDIINIVTPVLEKTFSELIIKVINKMVYHRKEQLFPNTL
ncbi:PREDICTED: uncharacterized protein LOC105460288 [Wasmannia auropunctata]|uniref:uncharacterized protein LOC105460288 n=1 Tax=Wasmannia auropunctata TaxID=64793 RepID=UPI0005EF7ED0|nr:PREDICTED: uncharacterized protein LOC105460288 [Wasmannia auropunctata]